MENIKKVSLSQVDRYSQIDRISVRLEIVGSVLAAVLILATMVLIA